LRIEGRIDVDTGIISAGVLFFVILVEGGNDLRNSVVVHEVRGG
jgi:hypothetical protein